MVVTPLTNNTENIIPMSLNLKEQYEKETGKSVWKIKNYTYTDDYTRWIRDYVNNSDSVAAKVVRKFSNKLKTNQ